MHAVPQGGFAAQESRVMASEIGEVLRQLDLKNNGSHPQSLEELRRVIAPLQAAIPELGRYDITTADGKREFPRTVASLSNLGIMLRGCDALKVLDTEGGSEGQHVRAAASFEHEYKLFSEAQTELERLTPDQFRALVRLYAPIAENSDGIKTVALAIAYGDLFKMPEVKTVLRSRVQDADLSDHDISLRQAFLPENIDKFRDIFPTYFTLPLRYQHHISTEVIDGVNLGHILQVETCAAALSGLKQIASADAQGLTFWLLPTLMDISGARANATKPESWVGSVLANRALTPTLLAFADKLPVLAETDEATFFDAFQASVANRPFYAPILSDKEIAVDQQQTVFRLARYLSWETDNRPISTLIEAWKGLGSEQKELLSSYFLRTGFDPEQPKVVVTYLPYIFTQLYAKHFDLPRATNMALDSVCKLLGSINEYADARTSAVRTYAGQNLWFKDLQGLTAESLEHPLVFEVHDSSGGTPEVRLRMSE